MLQPVIENDNNNNNKLMREMGSQIFYYEQKLTTAYNTFLFFFVLINASTDVLINLKTTSLVCIARSSHRNRRLA